MGFRLCDPYGDRQSDGRHCGRGAGQPRKGTRDGTVGRRKTDTDERFCATVGGSGLQRGRRVGEALGGRDYCVRERRFQESHRRLQQGEACVGEAGSPPTVDGLLRRADITGCGA